MIISNNNKVENHTVKHNNNNNNKNHRSSRIYKNRTTTSLVVREEKKYCRIVYGEFFDDTYEIYPKLFQYIKENSEFIVIMQLKSKDKLYNLKSLLQNLSTLNDRKLFTLLTEEFGLKIEEIQSMDESIYLQFSIISKESSSQSEKQEDFFNNTSPYYTSPLYIYFSIKYYRYDKTLSQLTPINMEFYNEITR